MHYLFVFGTRPEAMKLFPLARVLRSRGEKVTLLSTSQHPDLLAGVMEVFDMACDLSLPLPKKERDFIDLLRMFVTYLPRYISECSPSAVVVQGDTLSAFCGALVSFLMKVPAIHIEAGLRTYQSDSPYPEEALRRMIAPMTTVHFTTTEQAKTHLQKEGIQDHIYHVGNTIYDAMRCLCPKRQRSTPPYVLVTTHRRESDGEIRQGIFCAIRRLADAFVDFTFLVVLNENWKIQALAHQMLDEKKNIKLLPPKRPDAFYSLLSGATLVLTDSGGISEEASALGLFPLVLRDTTEREWEREEGKLCVVGTSEERIFRTVSEYIKKGIPIEKTTDMPKDSPSEHIADILQRIML